MNLRPLDSEANVCFTTVLHFCPLITLQLKLRRIEASWTRFKKLWLKHFGFVLSPESHFSFRVLSNKQQASEYLIGSYFLFSSRETFTCSRGKVVDRSENFSLLSLT